MMSWPESHGSQMRIGVLVPTVQAGTAVSSTWTERIADTGREVLGNGSQDVRFAEKPDG
jgi:hypothetical protein